MTGAISFLLLLMGALFVFVSGCLHEEEEHHTSRVGVLIGVLLLVMSWGLA